MGKLPEHDSIHGNQDVNYTKHYQWQSIKHRHNSRGNSLCKRVNIINGRNFNEMIV